MSKKICETLKKLQKCNFFFYNLNLIKVNNCWNITNEQKISQNKIWVCRMNEQANGSGYHKPY